MDAITLAASSTPHTTGRVRGHMARIRDLRDRHGWPEPRTVADLRSDPRVMLRNSLRGADPTPDELERAAALILVVADDLRDQLAREG